VNARGEVAQPNDYTADQIIEGITKALQGHDVEAVPGLIRLLAIKDPHRAQKVMDTIELGIFIARIPDDEAVSP